MHLHACLHPLTQDDLRAELSSMTDRCCGLQAQLDLLQATNAAAAAAKAAADGQPHTPAPGQAGSSAGGQASVVDSLLKGYVARIAELERELKAARQFQGLRRRTTTTSVPGGVASSAAGSHGELAGANCQGVTHNSRLQVPQLELCLRGH